ncbi:MAG: hypothetical protein OEZ13_00415 [Spirochaetia bacterium]|nr:hypothetical protein [Spirochaetia bacterium]
MPVSIYLILASVLYFLFFFFANYFAKKKKLIGKLAAQTAWIFLLFTNFLLTGFFYKTRGDYYANSSSINSELKLSNNIIKTNRIQWKTPDLWNLEKFHFIEKFFMPSRLIFQIQPFSSQYLIRLPAERAGGWIGCVTMSSEVVINYIDDYIKKQNFYFWHPLISSENEENLMKRYTEDKFYFRPTLKKYVFLDFINLKPKILYILTVSIKHENKINTLVWALEPSENTSIDFYMTKIIKNISIIK